MDISVFPIFSGNVDAPVIYLPSDSASALQIYDLLPNPKPTLMILTDIDWNRDLSPWAAPAVFKNGGIFTGGAAAYLQRLLSALPSIEAGLSPIWRGIAGYSLAGLFAVWTMYQTDVFTRFASLSGSLWFDGFTDYIKSNAAAVRPDYVYLSLGNREKQTRNPRMAAVETATFETLHLLQSLSVPAEFKSEVGGHFDHPNNRIARGIAAISLFRGSP